MDLSVYFNNTMLSDCIVEIMAESGEIIEKLPAHRFILQNSSSVFCTALELPTPSLPVTLYTDDELVAFKNMLRFFYCNNFDHVAHGESPAAMLQLMSMADRFDAPSCFNAALRSPVFWKKDLAESPEVLESIFAVKFGHMARWHDLQFKATSDLANKLVDVLPPHPLWDIVSQLAQFENGRQLQRLLLIHVGQMRMATQKSIERNDPTVDKEKAQALFDTLEKVLGLVHLLSLSPSMMGNGAAMAKAVDHIISARNGKLTTNDTKFIIRGVVKWSLYLSPAKEFSSIIANKLICTKYGMQVNFGDPSTFVKNWRASMGLVERRPDALKRQRQ